jgi:hypothetical protein
MFGTANALERGGHVTALEGAGNVTALEGGGNVTALEQGELDPEEVEDAVETQRLLDKV